MNAATDTLLHALDTARPAVDVLMAEHIAREHFGVEGRAVQQPSERDANFRLEMDGEPRFVLRLASAQEAPLALDCEMAVLAHLARHAPSLPVPRLQPTVHGESAVVVRVNGVHLTARLLNYLPGTLMDGQPVTPALLHSFGDLLGSLDRALRGFFHAGADRCIAWNPHAAPRLRPHASLLPDASLARLVAAILDDAEQRLLPRLAALRAQVIHGDAHAANVLVDPAAPERVTGLIDFGDCRHGARVTEVAIAAGDLLPGAADPLAVIGPLTAAFHSRAPLEEDELSVVRDVAQLRIAMTLAVFGWREHHGRNSAGGLAGYLSPAAAALERLQGLDTQTALSHLREACDLGSGAVTLPRPVPRDTLLERRRRLLGSRLALAYSRPLHVLRGDGVWLHEADGARCLDAYNNVPHVGHCHPRVVAAVARQAALLNTNTRYLYDIVLEYAERLTALLPAPLSACVFVNSGSEANDVAWRIAKAVTGRRGALVMRNAYHGITDAVDALAPWAVADRDIAAHVRTLDAPDTYRGPWRHDEREAGARYAAQADAAIASLAASGHGIAAFMVDSALCSEGMLQAPPGYLRAVAEKVRAAGGLVIADEVQAGFGRPGDDFWGFGAHHMPADLVTLGKPIANGIACGAVVTTPGILDEFTARIDFFSTFGGNPVACAAGLAVLDVLRDEGLQANALLTGQRLLAGLRELAERHPLIGDVRGRGLMAGVELVRDHERRTPASAEKRRVLDGMREHHVLIGSDGPHDNVLKIRPPMPFTRPHAERLLSALDEVLGVIETEPHAG